MPQTVFTLLMFSGQAEEAVRYYVESIPQSELLEIRYFGPEQPGSEGKVQGARLRLAGHDVRAFDSPVQHDFGFTPAVSLFIDCHDEPEFERCFAALAKGGFIMMPPANYGFSQRFGWCNDRFGVSWQVNLP
jgi:predicted 3-demethylubiquinone-9 3-methyltransferase (glyoxalase superfamily)